MTYYGPNYVRALRQQRAALPPIVATPDPAIRGGSLGGYGYVHGYGAGWVYRCYDAADDLLYVGYTMTLRPRLVQHRRTAPWFPEVALIRVVEYARAIDAEVAERVALRTERPRYNYPNGGKPRPAVIRAAGRQVEEAERGLAAARAALETATRRVAVAERTLTTARAALAAAQEGVTI